MSAIAQYLQGTGMKVSGSDRFFNEGKAGDIRTKLEVEGIQCYLQDGSGITAETDLVVASTAIEDTVVEIKKPGNWAFRLLKDLNYWPLLLPVKNYCGRWHQWQKHDYCNVV
ncbi:hypothetical protein [Niabella hibiscisoli]|uniref:hypothetical protein n=1 Tax=Niabella hibiscisoli TaxID=1825928 RepID=UPI001F10C886|nr:hypothetical protein [Niabella hibiscisoli]MCH5714964.1 hypothetical protein [Niabella hibiscisoli]